MFELKPNKGFSLNTLGVAQFRVGDYEQALGTLARSLELHAKESGSPDPSDLAFLAMTNHQLSRADEAKKLLNRLRETLKIPRWTNDAEAQAFLREAEALIDGDSLKLKG